MGNSGVTYNLPGTVSGVFFTKKDADAAYDALLKRGHTEDDISVLMSDETLSNHKSVFTDDDFTEQKEEKVEVNSPLERARDIIVSTIISVTTMVSLPGLGIAISNKLFRRITHTVDHPVEKKTVSDVIGTAVPEEHTESYGDSMREGGIILSVDPRNTIEKRAIVKDFKANNGHDILGDDGYTDLD